MSGTDSLPAGKIRADPTFAVPFTTLVSPLATCPVTGSDHVRCTVTWSPAEDHCLIELSLAESHVPLATPLLRFVFYCWRVTAYSPHLLIDALSPFFPPHLHRRRME